MAVSSLIQRRSGLKVHRYGFPNPVRWFSSHSSDAEIEKLAQSKKRGGPKAGRAVAAESFIKEYVEKNSGLFPKVGHIQNEVGGSWYIVKGIVSNIRATMLGTTHPENCENVNASTAAEHIAVSKVMATPYEPDNKTDLCGRHEFSFEAEKVQQGENKEETIELVTGTVECLSSLTVDPVSSDVTCTCCPSSSDHDKLDFSGTLGQQEASATSRQAERVKHGEDKEGSNEHSTDHVTAPEANNKNEESFSGILSALRSDKNPQGRSLLSRGILKEGNSFTKRLDLHANASLSSSWENQPGEEMVASREVNDTAFGLPESFTGSNSLTVLEGMEHLNTKASESVKGKNGDSTHNICQYLEEPLRKDELNEEDIDKLANFIKLNLGGSSTNIPKNKFVFSKIDESCEKSHLESETKATLHVTKKKERNLSAEYPALHRKSNHDDSSKVLTTALRTQVGKISSQKFDKTTGHSQLSVLTDEEESHEALEKCSLEEAGGHKAIVKFLPRDTRSEDIIHFLRKCGRILKVKFSSPEGAFFRDADVYFEKQQGLLNALVRPDATLRGVNVIVEAAAGKDISSRISIPSIIGDPDVPAAVVKHPTRTVKIEQLTREISLHDVVVALESWGCNVTGFFVGTLDSVAYVEFEEEDDKEAILVRHSIDVLGKQLLVSRIDAPRTTCVRISFHKSALINEVVKVYTSLGEPMLSRKRHPGILDVQYKIAEWPNMLKILNSLNRTKVHGHKLQAQPATIIPPPILKILWRHPEERIHIKNCLQKLLRNLGKNIVNKVDLADLPNFY